jgi:3D (Asp-Asp-Asp) domain-containing protein
MKQGLSAVFICIFSFLLFLPEAGFSQTLSMTVTAYDNCEICTGKTCEDEAYGITSTGNVASWGTVAVDPAVIPYGTFLKIEGFGELVFRAEDTGSDIRGNHIDVWMTSHEDAMQFGKRKLHVTIVPPFQKYYAFLNESNYFSYRIKVLSTFLCIGLPSVIR